MNGFFAGESNNRIRVIVKNICTVAMFQVLLYLLQYIFLPIIIFPAPTDSTLNDFILVTTTGIISFAGMWMAVDKLSYWIITIPAYYLLVNLYCPEGLYGINYKHPMFAYLASREIPFVTAAVLFMQFCIWIIVKISKYLIRRKTVKVT
ncbi:hypothetical protein [Clostridium thermarum]|uniref:hypothetical protein n=1 Tax=Clostridium thermarum TaxID=1716543 RepID=UPI00111E9643|nr:hypothetical protein [Clostridium thermarum]